VTLHNTGDTQIGTFWVCLDVAAREYDFLPSIPTNSSRAGRVDLRQPQPISRDVYASSSTTSPVDIAPAFGVFHFTTLIAHDAVGAGMVPGIQCDHSGGLHRLPGRRSWVRLDRGCARPARCTRVHRAAASLIAPAPRSLSTILGNRGQSEPCVLASLAPRLSTCHRYRVPETRPPPRPASNRDGSQPIPSRGRHVIRRAAIMILSHHRVPGSSTGPSIPQMFQEPGWERRKAPLGDEATGLTSPCCLPRKDYQGSANPRALARSNFGEGVLRKKKNHRV